MIPDLYHALPATIDNEMKLDDALPILLVVHGDQPGQAGFTTLAIDYRVGPFTCRVVQHLGAVLCLGPLPAGLECPSP